MEVLLLLTLILLNGIFAMSEIALVTARRTRLAGLGDEGHKAAAVALRLHDDPTRFLSTIQIGITSIGILNGIVGEAVLAEPFAIWLQGFGVEAEASSLLATVLVVVVITYISIVIGELVPKRIAQFNPERIALLVARPMNLLSIASRPFVRLLSVSTDGLLTLLGQRKKVGGGLTEDEIRAILAEGSDSGAIEPQEHDMVRNVFRLDDRQVGSLMIPRADIEYLDVNDAVEQNLIRVADSRHSRFPVCRGGLEDVLGMIDTKKLLKQRLRADGADPFGELQPVVYVPENLNGLDLLRHFRASQAQLALVVDEYGDVQGLVTLQDVLEAVTGELVPGNHADAWAFQREDGSWLLDGLMPIPELRDKLGLKAAPDEERGRFHTLSGLMMWLLGRIPHTGDVATLENWRLEVVDLDGKRVDKVLASLRPEAGISRAGERPGGHDH